MRLDLWVFAVSLILLTACGPAPVHFLREGSEASRLAQVRERVTLVPLWAYDANRPYEEFTGHLTPALGQDWLFVAERSGRVSALDPESGDWQWQVEIGELLTAGVGLGEKLVLVATDAGEIVALDRADGKTVWTRAVGGRVSVAPIVAGNLVVVRSGSNQVIALMERSGEIKWQFQKNTPSFSVRGVSAPLVIDQVVVAGFSDGNLVGIDLERGTELWNLIVARSQGDNEISRLIDIDANPVVIDELLIVAAYQDGVSAYGLRDLSKVWEVELSVLKNIAVSGAGLFLTDDEGVVNGLNLDNGELGWRQAALRGRGVSAPVPLNNRLVLVGDYQGFLHLLDIETGEIMGRSSIHGGAILALIAQKEDRVFVVSESGNVSAWALGVRD